MRAATTRDVPSRQDVDDQHGVVMGTDILNCSTHWAKPSTWATRPLDRINNWKTDAWPPSHLEEDKSGMDESWRSGSGRSGSGRPTGRMDSQRQRQVRSNRRATLLQSSPECIAGRRTQVVVAGHSHADFGRVHLSHTHTHRQRETRDCLSSITSHPKRRKKRWVWISHDAGFLETKQKRQVDSIRIWEPDIKW
jgi:hypothetical protein